MASLFGIKMEWSVLNKVEKQKEDKIKGTAFNVTFGFLSSSLMQ